MKFDNELIKDEAEFNRVIRKLAAKGLNEDEAVKTLSRDYRHLFHEPTKADILKLEERTVLQAIALTNRESIEKTGHPEIVSFRENGEMHHALYSKLSAEQITDFRERGVIL